MNDEATMTRRIAELEAENERLRAALRGIGNRAANRADVIGEKEGTLREIERAANAALAEGKEQCEIARTSSRICERGTECCVTRHEGKEHGE